MAGLILGLGAVHWASGRRRQAARAVYFSSVEGLFDRAVVRVQPSGFARMTGHWGAHEFDLQAVPDTLTFRKLPALWVMITLPEPLPVTATLDIMARPSGGEPFSHFSSLPQSLERPSFLPEVTALRSDDAAGLKVDYLAAHAPLFDDPRVKELIISPKGLRIVLLAEEAERGRYLLFRDAEMGLEPLKAERVSGLIETILALRADIFASAGA